MHQPRSDQIADVRDGPVVTQLNKLVIPQAVDAAPGDCRLPGQDLHKRTQHVGPCREPVLVLVNRRDPVPDLLDVVALELIARRSQYVFVVYHTKSPSLTTPPCCR